MTNHVKKILSPKEREILLLISIGKRNNEIAVIHEISVHTVRKHCKNIYRKLSVRNRTEAAWKADKIKPKNIPKPT